MGKRAVDIMLAGAGLLILSPLVVVLSALVKLSSPGPVLHRAQRSGRQGQLFTLYKFRSMRVGAAAAGPGITAHGDPRITEIGKFLRKTKLDELPQLWNVVKGDMSIVGPRPEDPRYVASYTAEQRRILDWRPGITSPASVTYRDEELVLAAADDVEAAYAEVMAEKISIDLAYFEQATIAGDVKWILRTLRAVVR